MFKKGDIAVYPAHGVGVVESVESKNISGKEQSFIMMRILDNDMTIMIPEEKIGQVGLREIINPDKIEEVFTILSEKVEPMDGKTWNKRFREYSEKIKTGSPTDAAEVFRDLMTLKIDKGLSFGESRMLDNVKNLLSQEIAVSTNDCADSIKSKLTNVFEH